MKKIEVGDILYASWGYSMTLPAWARVIKRTPKMATIVELASEFVTGDWAGGTSMPILDERKRHTEAKTFKVKERDGGEFLDGAKSYGKYWHHWDGEPKYHNHAD